jgi:DNA ligase-1
VGTGFKDTELVRFTDLMDTHKIPKKPNNYAVSDNLAPDQWFDAAVVWELQAADLVSECAL